MGDEYKKFPARLKKAMDVRGIRAVDLSIRTGIPKSTISRYLKGDFYPKSKSLGIITSELGVSGAWLMGYGDDDDMFDSVKDKVKSIIDTMSDEDISKLLKLIELIK